MSDRYEATTARVLTWNLERRRSDSPKAQFAIDHLLAQEPDVIALTEARTTLPLSQGHSIWSQPPVGSRFGADERKVQLWSKQPWTAIDRVGADGLDTTRFVAGTTTTPIGPVRVLGVCIPWHMAQVTSPPAPKMRPWELHHRYLEILTPMLRKLDGPTVIAGDFNQRVPRVKGGNHAAAAALSTAFSPTAIVTAGTLDGVVRPGIDHIAITNDLDASRTWGWSNEVDAVRVSDHDGAGADIHVR